jgi:hypothetical protein
MIGLNGVIATGNTVSGSETEGEMREAEFEDVIVRN